MKIVGIFNSNEEKVGNRLAGIKTYIAREQDEVNKILDEIEEDKEIGIIAFNEETYKMAEDRIKEMKKQNLPLVLKV